MVPDEAAVPEEVEEITALEAVEDTVIEEAAARIEEEEVSEEFTTFEAVEISIPEEAAIPEEVVEITALEAAEDTVIEEATAHIEETEETEEFITLEAVEISIPEEAAIPEEVVEITALEAVVDTIIEEAAEETVAEDEAIAIEESEETKTEDAVISAEETEEITAFELMGQTLREDASQDDSWDNLQDPEHRKVLKQVIKEYLESDEQGIGQLQLTDENIDKKPEAGKKPVKSVEKTLKYPKSEKKNKLIPTDENSVSDDEIKINYRGIKSKFADEYSDAVVMVRENMYASTDMIKDALFEFCSKGFRTIGDISSALLRPESSIKRSITKMIREGTLEENENKAYRSVPGVIGDV
jgi:hypothetical protein